MSSKKGQPGWIRSAYVVLKYPRASLMVKSVMVAIMFYIFSPVDIMPAAVFGPFGMVDDAGALAVFAWVAKTAFAYYAREAAKSEQ